MTEPDYPFASSSANLRFPNFADPADLSHFSVIIQDLSYTYDITAVAILQDYRHVRLPSTRLGPRRWSLLWSDDRIHVNTMRLGSPLELGLIVLGIGSGPRIMKAWINVLGAGLDVGARVQALQENRKLAPERLREAQLNNDLTAQRVRRVTAEADLVERARDEILGVDQDESLESDLSGLDELPPDTTPRTVYIAQLLEDPMRRILGYGGGELEITDDDE
jgi:hypothetical protein